MPRVAELIEFVHQGALAVGPECYGRWLCLQAGGPDSPSWLEQHARYASLACHAKVLGVLQSRRCALQRGRREQKASSSIA